MHDSSYMKMNINIIISAAGFVKSFFWLKKFLANPVTAWIYYLHGRLCAGH